jgi:TolA-binding protein
MKRTIGLMMILLAAAGCASVSKTAQQSADIKTTADKMSLEERVAKIEFILIKAGEYPASGTEKIDPTIVQRIETLEKQMAILYNEVHRLQELRVVPVK